MIMNHLLCVLNFALFQLLHDVPQSTRTNHLWAAYKCLKATMKYCFSLSHLFPWSRTAGTKTSSCSVLHEENFLFLLSSPWQTERSTDRYRQTEAELTWKPQRLPACLTDDVNLYLASSSAELGHLLMCVMLHNQLCQPKGWGTFLCLWLCASVNRLQTWWVMHPL